MSYVIQNIKWKVSSTNNPSMSSFKNIAQTSESRKAAKMEGNANHNTYHMLWLLISFFRVILSIVWALKCDGMPYGKITIIAQWCKQEQRNKYIHPSYDIT